MQRVFSSGLTPLVQFFLTLFQHDERIFSEKMTESHDGMTYIGAARELGYSEDFLEYISSFPNNLQEPVVVSFACMHCVR